MKESELGPLQDIRIIEIVGLGGAPFCGMMLADMGAEVIRAPVPVGGTSLPPAACSPPVEAVCRE